MIITKLDSYFMISLLSYESLSGYGKVPFHFVWKNYFNLQLLKERISCGDHDGGSTIVLKYAVPDFFKMVEDCCICS